MTLWGPGDNVSAKLNFDGAPYAPFSKGDKLGKAADWAADPAREAKDQKRAQGRGFRDPYHAYGASSSSFFAADDTETNWAFSVVDSSFRSNVGGGPSLGGSKGQIGSSNNGKTAVLRARGGRPGQQASGAGRPSNAAVAAATAQAAAPPVSRGPQAARGPRTMTIGSATQHNRRGGGRPQPWQNDRVKRKPSVAIGADWSHLQTNSFSELQKLSFPVPSSNVVGEYGYVQAFDRKMDKLTTAQRLRQVEVTEYNVSTSEDPVIEKLAKSASTQPTPERPHVYATDAVLALLMCATKSNNPWDILVTKKDGRIYFDKRDNSAIDLPSVDENSSNPPPETADNKIDSAPALALEASYINLNFAANVVLNGDKDRVTLDHPNPFSSGDEPASAPLLPKGYIYREFNLETSEEAPPIPLIVRTEVDSAVERGGKSELANVYALNEYGGSSHHLVWKERFASHRGAIVAAEMKNNLNKLSQWTLRSLLGEIHVMKIGFVSRVLPKDNHTHEIVSVLTQNPQIFAKQLGVNLNNGWGIIKSLVNVFTELTDGRYIILRDPNAQAVMIYSLPEGATFEELTSNA